MPVQTNVFVDPPKIGYSRNWYFSDYEVLNLLFSTFFEYHMSMVFFLKYVDILPKRSADYENIKLSGMTVNNFFLSFENFRKQKNFFFVAFFFAAVMYANTTKYLRFTKTVRLMQVLFLHSNYNWLIIVSLGFYLQYIG